MTEHNALLDTIAAVSTPRGKGGVALLRISGPDAARIGEAVFAPRGGKKLTDKPRYEFFGDILAPDEAEGGAFRVVDDGLAVFFKGPASFTGEDTVELCCHGGVLVTRTVLAACLAAGARQAERGEFTRRAFAAGKISLPEAEALGLLLDAGTDAQLRLSRSGMSGKLAAACAGLRTELTALLTDIYARVDFPEEDLGSIPDEEVRERVAALAEKTAALAATWRTGRAIAEGIPTVICGRTNAGKSTLYNRMVGSDEAIVTDIAGTTRDVLTSTVSFGGATLLLSDTAGIRENTSDAVEAIGVDRARERIDGAELVLFLLDGSRAPDADDAELAARLCGHPGTVIALLTKADAGTVCGGALALWEKFALREKISAKTGEGIDRLAAKISELFLDGSLDLGRDAILSSARQYEALRRTADALGEAAASLDAGFPPDVASTCLEDAAIGLSELDGRGHGAVSADVIDGIFSKFCVGK